MVVLSRVGQSLTQGLAVGLTLIFLLVISDPALAAAAESKGLVYRNPRVYNVQFSFELEPDPANISRSKDLKLWIPLPREWDSQSAVKIISVEPQPHGTFEDPEYGNRMAFWDFGTGPIRDTYRIDLRYRLESFEVDADVDLRQIKPYERSSDEYQFYTRSGPTIPINSKVRELARQAVDGEINPHLRAKKILEFVHNRMQYEIRFERGIPYLLTTFARDQASGVGHFRGDCSQYAALFVAMCRALGIPARSVYGFVGWRPLMKPEDLKDFSKLDTQLSPIGTAGARHKGLTPHMWAEFYLPGVGWVPVDPTANIFGRQGNQRIILSKGRDVIIGPHGPRKHDGYGFQWMLLKEGRVDGLLSGVWNIARIRKATVTVLHSTDPFPADALAKYEEYRYPPTKAEKALQDWRNDVLVRLWDAIRGRSDLAGC